MVYSFVHRSTTRPRARASAAQLRHLKSLGKLDAAELSVGFDAVTFQMVEDPDTREIFRVVTEARLWEISVVAFGADPTTEIREVAAMRFAPPLPMREQLHIEAESALAEIAEIEHEMNERAYMRAKLDSEIAEIQEAGVDLFLLANRGREALIDVARSEGEARRDDRARCVKTLAGTFSPPIAFWPCHGMDIASRAPSWASDEAVFEKGATRRMKHRIEHETSNS